MPERRFTIGSGYFERTEAQRWFFDVWYDSLIAVAKPIQIIVLATGEITPPGKYYYHYLCLDGDLGHCGQLISGAKPHQFSGGTSTVLALAMLAYCNDTDFIYLEQDGLAFGPWVDAMYDQIGSRGCIFGNSKLMGSHQSLMLVKHAFIPEYVKLYLGTGRENTPNNVGECKHTRLEHQHPDLFTRYSFGCDRDRPIPYDDPVFFVQKLTRAELEELKRRGLLKYEGEAPEGKFTNC